MPDSDAKVALVTGANAGMGLLTVLELARRGLRVVGSVRSDAKAEIVRKAADEAGVGVETVQFDITDHAGAAAAVEQLAPDILINNAGVVSYAAFEDSSEDEGRELFDVLYFGPLNLVRAALRPMRVRGEGRIINVSSSAGRVTFPMMGHYQAAKHALEAMSDALRMELASVGIQVVVVVPGAFRTQMIDEVRDDADRHAGSRFAAAYERMSRAMSAGARFMSDPQKAAEAIARAATTRNPEPRYVVGADAWLNVVTDPITPTRVRDFMMRRMLDL